jgi:hypothetical protein
MTVLANGRLVCENCGRAYDFPGGRDFQVSVLQMFSFSSMVRLDVKHRSNGDKRCCCNF